MSDYNENFANAIKFSLNEKDLSNIVIQNWVIVFVLIIIYILKFIVDDHTFKRVDIVLCFLDYSIIGLDINMHYANFIIILL